MPASLASLASFGRSFLSCHSGRASWRRGLRLFLAARRRWPCGRLVVRWSSVRWDVDGFCAVQVSGWGWPRWLPRFPFFFLRAVSDWRDDAAFGHGESLSWPRAAWDVLREWRWLRTLYPC